NVTKEVIRAESGSRRNERSTRKELRQPAESPPALIQSASLTISSCPLPNANGIRCENATIVARRTDPTPTAETELFPSLVPKRPQTTNPASGSAGMSHRGNVIGRPSPLQEVDPVHVDRLPMMENSHEKRETHGGLCGGDRDDEEDENLPFARSQSGAVTQEGQVGRVHHDLDGEKDVNGAAAEQSSGEPDAEQRRGGHEDVGKRNRADQPFSSLRARTNAPTRAARSKTEIASKWRR